jgi:hypothetical protein
MNRSRRFAALLASLFLLHLVMAAGGIMSVATDAAAAQNAGTAVTDLAAAPAADATSSQEEMPCSDEAPCHVPGAPSSCPSAVPCASAVMSSAQPVIALVSPSLLRPTAVVLRAPHTRLSPPELPPPRA